MSWSIINLIFESYFSVPFSSMFYIGMSFKLRFCCRGRQKGLPWEAVWLSLGQVPVGGLAWGLRAKQSSLCTVPDPVSVPPHVCPTPSGGDSCSVPGTFTYLFPTNSRKLITFDTTSFFPPFFPPFLIR